METDFADVRFTDASENVELFHWKENHSTSSYANFWVMTNLTANDNTTIYMYYNNSGASDGSDIENAFLLGTDWTGESSLPATYKGRKVINGDISDHRFLDPAGVVVGLIAKGKAKKDLSGFAIDLQTV